jgi:hypothetical protein
MEVLIVVAGIILVVAIGVALVFTIEGFLELLLWCWNWILGRINGRR